MKHKNQRRKKTKKHRRKKNIRRKVKKKITKISFKKFKNPKISKHIRQLKELNLLLKSKKILKRKKKQIIDNQINLLREISLRKLASSVSRSLNKTYKNFKKKQEIKRLKQTKLEEREKAKQIKLEKREKAKQIKEVQKEQKKLNRINEKIRLKEEKQRLREEQKEQKLIAKQI